MRLLVHVEGQTEETFVNLVLGTHLARVGYSIVGARLIGVAGARRRRGGAPSWQAVRDGILNHLKGDREAISTTMVDYYGMPPAWPGRTAAEALPQKERASFVQGAVAEDVRQHMGGDFDGRRCIPYVSMHEFEALLFSDCQRFAESVGHPNLASEMKAILTRFSDPEAIDDSQATTPSKRIIQLLPSYQKVLMGATAAEHIGLVLCPTQNVASVAAGSSAARRVREGVPGRTSSGRNAAAGLPAATRRARPQASARFVAFSRSTACTPSRSAPRARTPANALTRRFVWDRALAVIRQRCVNFAQWLAQLEAVPS